MNKEEERLPEWDSPAWSDVIGDDPPQTGCPPLLSMDSLFWIERESRRKMQVTDRCGRKGRPWASARITIHT